MVLLGRRPLLKQMDFGKSSKQPLTPPCFVSLHISLKRKKLCSISEYALFNIRKYFPAKNTFSSPVSCRYLSCLASPPRHLAWKHNIQNILNIANNLERTEIFHMQYFANNFDMNTSKNAQKYYANMAFTLDR